MPWRQRRASRFIIPRSLRCCPASGSHIKKSLVATERRRGWVRLARHVWLTRRMPAMRQQPERLVFIDETSVKTNLTRLRGRARRGQRLEMDALFGNWGTQTIIAGLTAG